MSRRLLARLAAAAALAAPAALHAQLLGSLGYNVFVFDDFTASGSETNGRLLVGGNASLNSYATGLSVTDDALYSLVVGNTLTANGWGILHGLGYAASIVGTAPSLNWAPGAPRITAGGAAPLTAAQILAERQRLEALSAQLGALGTSVSAAVSEAFGTWTFTAPAPAGGTPTLYTFDVYAGANALNPNGKAFDDACTINVNVPTFATAVINVHGASARTTQCGMFVNGGGNAGDGSPAGAGRVLWNYVDASALTLRGSFLGSLLAPNANVTMAWSQGVGDVAVKSMTSAGGGNTEFYVRPFVGTLPPPPGQPPVTSTPEPATLGLAATGLALLGGVAGRRRKTMR